MTKEVLAKQRFGFTTYQARSQNRLGQVLEVLLLAGYLSFYLAILNNENPPAIPWVDYFKKRLAKMK